MDRTVRRAPPSKHEENRLADGREYTLQAHVHHNSTTRRRRRNSRTVTDPSKAICPRSPHNLHVRVQRDDPRRSNKRTNWRAAMFEPVWWPYSEMYIHTHSLLMHALCIHILNILLNIMRYNTICTGILQTNSPLATCLCLYRWWWWWCATISCALKSGLEVSLD